MVDSYPHIAKDIVKALATKPQPVTRHGKTGGSTMTYACSNEDFDVIFDANPNSVPGYLYCTFA